MLLSALSIIRIHYPAILLSSMMFHGITLCSLLVIDINIIIITLLSISQFLSTYIEQVHTWKTAGQLLSLGLNKPLYSAERCSIQRYRYYRMICFNSYKSS